MFTSLSAVLAWLHSWSGCSPANTPSPLLLPWRSCCYIQQGEEEECSLLLLCVVRLSYCNELPCPNGWSEWDSLDAGGEPKLFWLYDLPLAARSHLLRWSSHVHVPMGTACGCSHLLPLPVFQSTPGLPLTPSSGCSLGIHHNPW